MLCLEKRENPVCKRSLLRSIGAGFGIGSAAIGCALAASADEVATTVGYSNWSTIITTAETQISVANVVAVLASTVGACVALVFMWWGVRKGVRMLMSAFKKGKLRV